MNRLRTLVLAVGLLSNVIGYAYDFEVDGIYYKITSKGAEYTVEVTYKDFNSSTNYAGDIEIPSTVNRNGVAYSSVTYNVTGIGSYAFHGCSNLTSITLPEGVTSIGYGAFDNCCNLTSVTIPENVISVGEWAFYCCESLDSLIIPQSVTSIGENAFYGCGNLTSISVAKGNAIYDSRNNCNAIIETNSNTLIVGCSSTVIPEDVTDIKEFAFTDCASLASITIPQSVTSIGENAFLRCSNLVSISVEKGNAIYDSRDNCNAIILTNNNTLIVGCSSTVIPEDVDSIGDYAFNWCSKLTSIVIPESVRYIGNYAFNGCTSLKELTFKDGSEDLLLGCNYYSSNQTGEGLFYDCPLEKIYLGRNLSFYSGESCGYSPFYNKVELTTVIISNNVTILGSDTFHGCTGELTVNCNIPSNAFYGSKFSKVVVGDGVTSIGNSAFYYCSSLTSITIPENVMSIGNYAFSGCSSLASITIPESVTSIGNSAFYYCSSLTSITIPENVMSIGNYAFSGCSSLASITIPESVTSIGSDAFSGCNSLSAVHVGCIGNWCSIEFGSNPLSYAKNLYQNGELVTELVIPDTVSVIKANAFSGCSCLTSVVIPENVASIGVDAFRNCNGLTAVYISSIEAWCNIRFESNYQSGGANPLEYAGDLFLNGELLTELVIPENVSTIKNFAFCKSSITSVTIPKSVTSIENNAFNGCEELREVINYSNLDIQKGWKNNGYVGFYAQRIVTIDDIVGKYCFYTPTKGEHYLSYYLGEDTKLILPQDYKGDDYMIGEMAFMNNDSIISVEVPQTVGTIGKSAFAGCNNLAIVTLARGVMVIENKAFENCTNLTALSFPKSLTAIGNNAFSGCSGLTNLSCSANIETYGNGAFEGCTAVETLVVMGNVMPTIPSDKLTSITLYSPVPLETAGFANKVYRNATVYVPKGSLESYQTADVWKNFWTIKEFDPTGIEGVTMDAIDAPIYNMEGMRVNGALENLPVGVYIQNGKKFVVM